MKMVAIHKPEFEGSFAVKWIEYCRVNSIPHVVLNFFDSDIHAQLKEYQVTHVLWHFGQIWKDLLTARNIIYSASMAGVKVFPDINTSWHFDDKVAQKYLLEAMDIRMAEAQVFYSLEDSYEWIGHHASFPLVAKLRCGSGSSNVKLIHNSSQARRFSRRMFTRGMNPASVSGFSAVKRIAGTKSQRRNLRGNLKKLQHRIFMRLIGVRAYPNELGYVYFQEYLPQNKFDTKVIVVGDRAIGVRRRIRKNDFRASGGGDMDFNIKEVDISCVKSAFELVKKLKLQCAAVDFVHDRKGSPRVLEISFGTNFTSFEQCPGYWDSKLDFHPCKIEMEYGIIEDLLND